MMKKLLLILLLLPLISNAQTDKLYHNIAGNVISTGIGYGTYKLTNKVGLSIVSGLVSGVAAGYLKEELYDKQWKKGTYDKKDLYATSWGSAVGSICLVVLIDNNKKKKQLKNLFKE